MTEGALQRAWFGETAWVSFRESLRHFLRKCHLPLGKVIPLLGVEYCSRCRWQMKGTMRRCCGQRKPRKSAKHPKVLLGTANGKARRAKGLLSLQGRRMGEVYTTLAIMNVAEPLPHHNYSLFNIHYSLFIGNAGRGKATADAVAVIYLPCGKCDILLLPKE